MSNVRKFPNMKKPEPIDSLRDSMVKMNSLFAKLTDMSKASTRGSERMARFNADGIPSLIIQDGKIFASGPTLVKK